MTYSHRCLRGLVIPGTNFSPARSSLVRVPLPEGAGAGPSPRRGAPGRGIGPSAKAAAPARWRDFRAEAFSGYGQRLWRMGGPRQGAGFVEKDPGNLRHAGARVRLLARDMLPTAPRVCRLSLANGRMKPDSHGHCRNAAGRRLA
jgi:hypothetical protein